MFDEWSGLADLLANMIEKYAADLDIADMPDTKIDMESKVEFIGERIESCNASSAVMKYNNRDRTVQTILGESDKGDTDKGDTDGKNTHKGNYSRKRH